MRAHWGDIVVLDFPFSDGSGSKIRPALVVASDMISQRTTDTIIASISSSTHRASLMQFLIDPAKPEGRLSGLRQPSMVQCENLHTVDQTRLIKAIGKLSPATMQQVNDCLKVALNLP